MIKQYNGLILGIAIISTFNASALAYTAKKTVSVTAITTTAPVISAPETRYASYTYETTYPVETIEKRFAIGPKFGSLGVGGEARVKVMDNIYARLSAYSLNTKKLPISSNLNFSTKVKLLNIPLMVDYHPMPDSGFRVSGGITYRNNTAKLNMTPKVNTKLHGNIYTPTQIGTVQGSIKSRTKIAPVLTIGYDSSLLSNNLVSFDAEIGAMYINKPKITLASNGTLKDNAQFIADLNKSVIVKKARFAPVLGIGIKFNL